MLSQKWTGCTLRGSAASGRLWCGGLPELTLTSLEAALNLNPRAGPSSTISSAQICAGHLYTRLPTGCSWVLGGCNRRPHKRRQRPPLQPRMQTPAQAPPAWPSYRPHTAWQPASRRQLRAQYLGPAIDTATPAPLSEFVNFHKLTSYIDHFYCYTWAWAAHYDYYHKVVNLFQGQNDYSHQQVEQRGQRAPFCRTPTTGPLGCPALLLCAFCSK